MAVVDVKIRHRLECPEVDILTLGIVVSSPPCRDAGGEVPNPVDFFVRKAMYTEVSEV